MEFMTKNLAVLIDYENFARDRFETDLLLKRLEERGRLLIKRAYADWGRFAGAKHSMLRSAVDLVELPSHGVGKNQADIRLVVDAIEIALTRDYIDTFVLVSGDSDMSPLVSKLREYNRYVIVIARASSVSSLLAGCCDEFIYYRDLISPGGAESIRMLQIEDAFELAQSAIEKMQMAGVPLRGSQLKSFMTRLNPEFHQRNYGCRQFKDFIKLLGDQGICQSIPRADGDFEISTDSIRSTLRTNRSTVSIIKEVNQTETTSAWSPADDKASLSPMEGEMNDQLIDTLWWAVKLNGQEKELAAGSISLSRLVANVKKLFPDFSPKKFGFFKAGGYKKMLQMLEACQWCELASNSKGSFVIRWSESFLARRPSLQPPEIIPESDEKRLRFSPNGILPLGAADLIKPTRAEELKQRPLFILLNEEHES